MDDKKEIQDLTEALQRAAYSKPTKANEVACRHIARVLVSEGYGKIKKGEKAFAEKTLAEMQEEVHENAVAHGWWDNPRQPGELLMLVVSEVSEAFEEVRNNHAMSETYYSEGGKMEGVPSELADIIIRVMDLSEYYGINLSEVIAEKHKFNLTRPFKHGGKKL